MNIISSYKNIGDETQYSSFTCELNSNTILRFDINSENKECGVTMEDKVSGIVDISATIRKDDIKSLIKTLRIISSQL